jgi:hypothetical protein
MKKKCVKLMDEIVKLLRGWNKSIDIIILLFGFVLIQGDHFTIK